MKKQFLLGILIMGVISFLTQAQAWAQPQIEKIHEKIERRYPALDHLDGASFQGLPHDKIVLFDVREAREYAVSHLDGAIRVDPDIDAATFLETYGEQLADRKLVFYCSVGRRSSALAARVQAAMGVASEEQVYNLKGGIFRWRNENRALTRGHQPTSSVHPFNAWWGRLIKDKSAIRYKPER